MKCQDCDYELLPTITNNSGLYCPNCTGKTYTTTYTQPSAQIKNDKVDKPLKVKWTPEELKRYTTEYGIISDTPLVTGDELSNTPEGENKYLPQPKGKPMSRNSVFNLGSKGELGEQSIDSDIEGCVIGIPNDEQKEQLKEYLGKPKSDSELSMEDVIDKYKQPSGQTDFRAAMKEWAGICMGKMAGIMEEAISENSQLKSQKSELMECLKEFVEWNQMGYPVPIEKITRAKELISKQISNK